MNNLLLLEKNFFVKKIGYQFSDVVCESKISQKKMQILSKKKECKFIKIEFQVKKNMKLKCLVML